jgi:hypothetical protein
MIDLEDAPVVARGLWYYAGTVRLSVEIVSLPYDYWFKVGVADNILQSGDEPRPLGPDGVLYYVTFTALLDSPGFPTVEEAKAHAQTRAPTPIAWEA